MSDRVRRKVSATLPSGSTITLAELTGKEELAAAAEADAVDSAGQRRLIGNWALIMRSVETLNDKDFDQSSYTAETFKDAWSREDWEALNILFDRLHTMEAGGEALNTFRTSIRFHT